MSIKQLSVFVQNEHGMLNEVTSFLAANDINIRALSIADTQEFGIMRLIVDDTARAQRVLNSGGWVTAVNEVVGAVLEDKPGGLAKIVSLITDAGADMQYAYAFLTRNSDPYLVIRVDDNDTVEQALKSAGIRIVNDQDISKM